MMKKVISKRVKIFGWEKLEMLNIIEIVKLIVKGIKLF